MSKLCFNELSSELVSIWPEIQVPVDGNSCAELNFIEAGASRLHCQCILFSKNTGILLLDVATSARGAQSSHFVIDLGNGSVSQRLTFDGDAVMVRWSPCGRFLAGADRGHGRPNSTPSLLAIFDSRTGMYKPSNVLHLCEGACFAELVWAHDSSTLTIAWTEALPEHHQIEDVDNVRYFSWACSIISFKQLP